MRVELKDCTHLLQVRHDSIYKGASPNHTGRVLSGCRYDLKLVVAHLEDRMYSCYMYSRTEVLQV